MRASSAAFPSAESSAANDKAVNRPAGTSRATRGGDCPPSFANHRHRPKVRECHLSSKRMVLFVICDEVKHPRLGAR